MYVINGGGFCSLFFCFVVFLLLLKFLDLVGLIGFGFGGIIFGMNCWGVMKFGRIKGCFGVIRGLRIVAYILEGGIFFLFFVFLFLKFLEFFIIGRFVGGRKIKFL